MARELIPNIIYDIFRALAQLQAHLIDLERKLSSSRCISPEIQKLIEEIEERCDYGIKLVQSLLIIGSETKEYNIKVSGNNNVIYMAHQTVLPNHAYGQSGKRRGRSIPERIKNKKLGASNQKEENEHLTSILVNRAIVLVIDLIHRRIYYKGIEFRLQPIHFKFLAALANSPMKLLHKEHLDALMKSRKIKDDTDRIDYMRNYKNKMLGQFWRNLVERIGNDGKEITADEIGRLISSQDGGYQLNLARYQVCFYLEKGLEVPTEYQNLLPEWAKKDHN